MSKIAKALEKARAEQAHQVDDARGEGSRPASPEIQEPAQTPPNYSHTEVVNINENHLASSRIVVPQQNQEVTDLYNLLRTQILQRTRDKGLNTLMVTSALSREGKTTTSINLAMSIARDMQQTALLVETDLRKPDISKYLGLESRPGLTNYLMEEIPLDTLLVNPGIDKLVVLPAGRALQGSTDLLGSPRMKRLVQELKVRYPDRYVIFDSLPLLNMPDALVFATYVDAILMVVEAGRTSQQDVLAALDLIKGRNILGLVMNKVQA